MQLTRTVAPSALPVGLWEVKRPDILHDDDDDYLTALVQAAVAYLDGPTGILGNCIMTQTWRVDLERWNRTIVLPVGPVAGVTIKYLGPDEEEQILPGAAYNLALGYGAAPTLYLKTDTAWPQLADVPYPVRIEVVCGVDSCPEDLKSAICILVKHWFRQRMPSEGAVETPPAFDALIGPRRRLVW